MVTQTDSRPLKTVLIDAAAQLTRCTENGQLEAELLLAHALQKPRSHLKAWPEKLIHPADQKSLNALINKRCEGIPLAYLTGKREFWSLTLMVSPAVLIPRPETEHIIEVSLQLNSTAKGRVADLGTGSGAIALALARERPLWQILATDISPEALTIAEQNKRIHKISNVTFCPGHWCDPLANLTFDLIISNPPYIAKGDPCLPTLAFEPITALTSGVDGLDDIRILIRQAAKHLNPQGWLILEHGYSQGSAIRALFTKHGYRDIQTRRDLQDHDRITYGRCPMPMANPSELA